jgi:hypothetical protein
MQYFKKERIAPHLIAEGIDLMKSVVLAKIKDLAGLLASAARIRNLDLIARIWETNQIKRSFFSMIRPLA